MHRDHPVIDYPAVVDDATQLIDVRESHELEETGTLPGARNIPLGDLPVRAGELNPSRRVVVLCRSGARGAVACEALTAAGFSDVVNLAGGMLAWKEGTSE